MKKHTLNQKSKLYKPNSRLYMMLTIVLCIIVIPSFVILCLNIKNAYISTILSALISFFGGGLASVIIAWLIDISMCNKRKIDLITRKKLCIGYISMFLDDLFQSFADSQSNCGSSISQGWEFWFRKLEKENFNKNNVNFYNQMLSTYVCLNEIKNEINQLNNGELKDYINKNDSGLLSELLILSDACSRIQNLIFLNKEENLEHIIFCVNDVISTVFVFCDFLQKKYISHSKINTLMNLS